MSLHAKCSPLGNRVLVGMLSHRAVSFYRAKLPLVFCPTSTRPEILFDHHLIHSLACHGR